MELSKYLEYGVGALAVGGLIYVSIILAGIIKNHIGTATKANQKLSDAIESMLRFLERGNKK